MACSDHLETVAERVALVDKDGVDAVLPCPAGDARPYGGHAADFRLALHPPLQYTPDNALMDELVAHFELALGDEMRHARRGTGAAGTAIDSAVAVEDGVAAMRALVARRAGPHHVADAGDAGILGVGELDLLLHQRRQPRDVDR